MGLITLSGDAGCRPGEVARLLARTLRYEFISESEVAQLLTAEFGGTDGIPPRAWPHAATAVLSRLLASDSLVVCFPDAEALFATMPDALRVRLTAPASYRAGALMIDQRLPRSEASKRLRLLEKEQRAIRRQRFGRIAAAPVDLAINAASFDPGSIAQLIATAYARQDHSPQPAQATAEHEFQTRLHLARFGLHPAAGKAALQQAHFGHPSEKVFANLLDFYGIAWQYEPRSFAVQWDKDGRVLESFTPDFHLPELDLYIELTTMKQSLVTRKNRKVKLLRATYPDLNIQVFYQKDIQNLVFKYGLAEREVEA